MTSLAGATAADAVTAEDAYGVLGAVNPLAMLAASASSSRVPPTVTQLIDGYETMSGPSAPSIPTKPVSLTTPELVKLRALGKSKALYLRSGEKKAFNLERNDVVERLTQAVGFNGVLDTCCVTPNLKGVPDPNQCTKVELTKSLRRVLDGQWEEVGRTNNPLNS